MRSSRLIIYGLLVTGLFSIVRIYRNAVNKFRIEENLGFGSNVAQFRSGKHMVFRRSLGKAQRPIVVAPWTVPAEELTDDKSDHRSFVFAETAKLDIEYGVRLTGVDKKDNEKIKMQAARRLCARSEKYSQSAQPALRCKQNLELLKCVSCSERDGTWYTAVSETGAVFGKVHNGTKLQFPNYNDGPYMYQHLDIAVPIAGQDDKLRRFAAKLGPSIKKFRSGIFGAKITIRLLITRFSFDSPAIGTSELEEFRMQLTEAAGLVEVADRVVFVEVKDSPQFSRAKAVNALHRETFHSDDSVLACIDVDLSIESKFLRNALTYPFPNSSAYFPIMFSAFEPESVELVDKFQPQTKQWRFSKHHGDWRIFSFGMYVLAGSDAAQLTMDESFVGWGGEDNDFYSRVTKKLNVIRLQEQGLTHVWHPKNCDLGDFVGKKYHTACVGSMAHFEGSHVGMYLKYLKRTDPAAFEKIMSHAGDGESTMKEAGQLYEEMPTVLVGVISSRANFGTRVKSIIDTWGQPENIPEKISLRFVVGAPPEGSEAFGKSVEEDKAQLAQIAGIKDLSMIVVMSDVVDDEYPPVKKNTAMIEYLNKIVLDLESNVDAPSTFQWIYKVDDDAYVNFDALLSFLRTRSSEGHHMYGERGTGRAEDQEGLKNGGLVKPYCTGGPGYVMSRQTVKDTAPHFKECVNEFDNSKYREFLWHSDTAIGICIYKHTGVGCWDDKDYYKHRNFRHNHKKEDPFIPSSQLGKTIATHPFKDYISMNKQHLRYVKLSIK